MPRTYTRKNPIEHLTRHAWLGELVVEAVRQSGILSRGPRKGDDEAKARRPHRRTRRRVAPVEAPAVEA